MAIKKSLFAYALAMVVGGAALMAVPDHAAAQRTIVPGPIKDFDRRSNSGDCAYLNDDGQPVFYLMEHFSDVQFNPSKFIARSIRATKKGISDAGGNFITWGVIEGSTFGGKVVTPYKSRKIDPEKEQGQVNIGRLDVAPGNTFLIGITERKAKNGSLSGVGGCLTGFFISPGE